MWECHITETSTPLKPSRSKKKTLYVRADWHPNREGTRLRFSADELPFHILYYNYCNNLVLKLHYSVSKSILFFL